MRNLPLPTLPSSSFSFSLAFSLAFVLSSLSISLLPNESAAAVAAADPSGLSEPSQKRPSIYGEANEHIDPWKDPEAWRAKWGARRPPEGESSPPAFFPTADVRPAPFSFDGAEVRGHPWNVAGTRPFPKAVGAVGMGTEVSAARRQDGVSDESFARMRMEGGIFRGGAGAKIETVEGLAILKGHAGGIAALAGYTLDRHFSERNSWLSARGIEVDAITPNLREGKRNSGVWDTLVLWGLFNSAMSRPESLLWLHHHSRDPGVVSWMAERAAETRAASVRDLAAAIASRSKELAESGLAPDPASAPAEPSLIAAIHPDAALAGGADRSKIVLKSGISIGTTTRINAYFAFCLSIQAHAKRIAVACVPTRGSDANMDALREGELDAGMVELQAAAGWGGPKTLRSAYGASLFSNRAALFVGRDSGISDWRDLDPKKHVLALMGANAEYLWRDVLRAEPSLSSIPVLYVPSMKESVERISGDSKLVGLGVAPLGSVFSNSFEEAAKGRLRMVTTGWKVGAAADVLGNPLYFEIRVDPKSFPALTDGKPISTIASPTVLFLSESWVKSVDPEDLADLGQAVTYAAKEWRDGNP